MRDRKWVDSHEKGGDEELEGVEREGSIIWETIYFQ